MSERHPDERQQRTDHELEPLHVEEVRVSTGRYERLHALERDIALIVAAVGDRGEPREGARLGLITDETSRLYDDRRVSMASVERVLEALVEDDVLEIVGPDRYRATLDTARLIDHYLERIGELWADKVAEEDGTKVVVERRQVAEAAEPPEQGGVEAHDG